jgi:hypothetical protein
VRALAPKSIDAAKPIFAAFFFCIRPFRPTPTVSFSIKSLKGNGSRFAEAPVGASCESGRPPHFKPATAAGTFRSEAQRASAGNRSGRLPAKNPSITSEYPARERGGTVMDTLGLNTYAYLQLNAATCSSPGGTSAEVQRRAKHAHHIASTERSNTCERMPSGNVASMANKFQMKQSCAADRSRRLCRQPSAGVFLFGLMRTTSSGDRAQARVPYDAAQSPNQSTLGGCLTAKCPGTTRTPLRF